MRRSVLVIDDDKSFQVLVREALASEGFDVRAAGTLARAATELDADAPDVIVLDRRLPDGDGLDFLRRLRASGEAIPLVLVVTAYGDVENAVAALRAGAADYLTKPIQIADLVVKLGKVLEARGLRDRLSVARTTAAGPPPVAPSSSAMRAVHDQLTRVAASPQTPVLLLGQSGVGKQRAAELLHELTHHATADAPFMEVNCAALPDELVESELFGHERGAFTDARATRRGLIEMAAGGTLFLDEVTEMPPRTQAKLLKFLDGMTFRRLGGQREISVELRVVAASNRDIRAEVTAGRFREDLYHRLGVFCVAIPALSQHREDIPLLATGFVKHFATRIKKRNLSLSRDALAALTAYHYPGNVRELRNIVERAVILAAGPEITARDLLIPSSTSEPRGEGGFFAVPLRADGSPPSLDEIDRAYVARVLEHCAGHRTAAAQTLGISYPTFLKRLRDLGID